MNTALKTAAALIAAALVIALLSMASKHDKPYFCQSAQDTNCQAYTNSIGK